MRRLTASKALLALAITGVAACIGDLGSDPADGTDPSGPSGGSSSGGGGPTGGSPTGGNPTGGTGGNPPPDGTPVDKLMPAGIRRLTNAEYDATVRVLLGTNLKPSESFAPDSRQDGFTVNEAQRVDPVLAKQLAAAAETLAAEAKGKIATFAPCADPNTQAEACAADFIRSFGTRAYRRPLDAAEADALLKVYRAGAEGATYADGIELVVRAILQSPGFLYHTELGDGSGGDSIALTPYELASSLSYLVTAGPPDDALLAAAASGALSTPEGREAEVRRLLGTPAARERLVRIVREWLGVDRISVTAKDSNVFSNFAELRPSMEAESERFVSEVLANSGGTVGELLGADWTFADAKLAAFYGASGEGRVSVPNRRGILNQGAFLSVYSHATETAPVLRGVAVLRRVACINIPSPTELNLDVVPPVPDPTKTVRERFSIHSTDDACSSCHAHIDAVGFAFERFDGIGKFRGPNDLDSGKPVDSTVTVAVGADFDGTYPDSNALAAALANSQSVRSCFARHLFRASAGRSGAAHAESEESFLRAWESIPEAQQGNIVETLIAYVKSSLFSHRRAQ